MLYSLNLNVSKDFSSFLKKADLFLRLKTMGWAWRFLKAPQPDKWCFIIGCYNSGTTLLNQLLGLHPSIGSMPNEGQFYTRQLTRGADVGLRRLWALKPEIFRMDENHKGLVDPDRLKREWAWFYNDVDRPVLIEKTIANSARTRWLQQNFRPAYFIVLVRDPYAVAEGIRRKEGHTLEQAILQWKNSYNEIFSAQPFLENCLVLTYEELTADPSATLLKIADFLELPAFNFKKEGKQFTVHKFTSEISNQNARSYSNLSAEDFALINQIAGDEIVSFNYRLHVP